jgi:hypothetical protein
MIAVLQRERSSLKWRLWTRECNVTNRKEAAANRDLAELERLAVWIEGWAKRDLSPELSFAVQVCLEAVANIIMYGCKTWVGCRRGRSLGSSMVAWIGITAAHSIRPGSRPPVPASSRGKGRQSRHPSDAQLYQRRTLRTSR